jgi:uncharacterized damage-inducible protein DinB
MITSDYCRLMARYNQWVNAQLYDICARVPDRERRRDVGVFFRSIHGTLNHLLYGDRVWLGRFIGQPCAVTVFGQELYANFEELRRERERTDAAIADWAETITADWLAAPLTYISNVDGITRTLPAGAIVIHFFNHQTHHRGQVSDMLARGGYDTPTIDIPWMPEFATAG